MSYRYITKVIPAGHLGLHHFGLMPPDFELARTRYIREGCEEVFACTVSGAQLSYFDTRVQVGQWRFGNNHMFLTMLLKWSKMLLKKWDGLDPVRPMPS